MRIKTFLVVIFLLIAVQAFATTYYIDYTAGADTNNGTSTSTPWQRCPGMKGFTGSYTHAAGDRFVFKGGVTWPYAALPLTIKDSGVRGNPDVYTSDKTWYNGASWTRPIFDGENQLADYASIIYSLNKTHFTLEYIKITGAGLEGADDDKSYGVMLNGSYGTGLNGVTIQYMELIPFSNSNLVLAACGGGATTTGLVIQYNTFYGSMNHIQMGCTDNTSTVDGMIIRGNTFSGYTQFSSSGDHPDGIHLHNKSGALRRFSNLEISGNKFYGYWQSSNTAQVSIEDSVSSAKIFNNVFTINNTVGVGKYIFSPGQVAVYGSDNVEIYNNTFCADTIGGTPNWPLSNITFSVGLSAYSGTFKVKNNIFSGARNSVIYAPTMTVDIDYNLHSLSFDGSPGTWDKNSKTWAQWQAQGSDLHGRTADPKFVSIPTDLSLQSDSDAINKGVDLSASFTTDLLGNVRPTGANSWDVGAYEYGANADTTPPTISSATINKDGDTLTLVFDEVVTVNTSTGFTLGMSGGAAGLIYTSGSFTNTLVYAITGRNIDTAETGTLDYATVANGIEDAAGNDLASTGESDEVVTNDSEYTPSATTYIVTLQASGDCTITPLANQVIVSGEAASYTCAANGNSGCAAWTGTCGGTGTTSFTSSAITSDCTVIQGCYKIAPDVAIGSGGAAVTLGSGAVGTLY